MRLILASASPRRRELLDALDLRFTVCPSDIEEGEEATEDPATLVETLARKKAQDIYTREPNKDGLFVLGGDTVVALGGRIFGKPRDHAQARDMLRALSGNTQTVYSGVAICAQERTVSATCCTRVTFSSLSDAEIERYIVCYAPYDKAGAYGIQDAGRLFVSTIDGDYDNVVGLPLFTVNSLLKTEFSMDLYTFSNKSVQIRKDDVR